MITSKQSYDRVTVITINYNMANELKATIDSVINQKYENIEYIIIDGGSIDESADIIKYNKEKIHNWVSEKDSGRSDAMNKGVRLATGDWIIFMNAGDQFHDGNVIDDIFNHKKYEADLVFGHALRIYPKINTTRFVSAGPDSMLPERMNCCHQALFTRRDVLLEHPFDGRLSIVFDYEFMIWAKVTGKRFEMVDRIVCCFSGGGISDQKRYLALREHFKVLNRYIVMTPLKTIKFCAGGALQILSGYLRRALPLFLVRLFLTFKKGRGASG